MIVTYAIRAATGFGCVMSLADQRMLIAGTNGVPAGKTYSVRILPTDSTKWQYSVDGSGWLPLIGNAISSTPTTIEGTCTVAHMAAVVQSY